MRPTFLCSLVLALLLSRGGMAQHADPVAPAPGESKPAVQPPAPPPAPPEITLLEPGAEPRQSFRIKPAPDLVQACRLRLLMNMSMTMDGQDYPSSPLPAMLITMHLAVTGVSPEGDITYTMSISECRVEENPETPAGIATMMNQALAPLAKLTGSATVTSRGISKEVKFKPPDDLPQDAAAAVSGLSDQMSQISAPLPEEPIGTGAKWRVKSKIRSQGMVIDQTATYTLTEVRDAAMFMDVDMDQTAEAQKIKSPGGPEGTEIELETLKSSGGGKVELPLAKLVPTQAAMKMATELAMKIIQGEQIMKMKQSVKLELTYSPADAPAATPDAPAPDAGRQAGPAPSTVNRRETTITRGEYGDAWPFTVDSGVLRGVPSGQRTSRGTELAEVTFTTAGKTYAVNGTARATGRYADIKDIWAADPSIPGAKKNIGPIIDRGLKLASGS